MAEKIIKSFYDIWIENGILFVHYKNDAVVDIKMAEQMYNQRTELCNGVAYPLFGDARLVKYWTKEARVFQSTEYHNKLINAMAVHVNSSSVHSTLVNFYLKFDRPKTPIRFFADRTKGLHWLEQFKYIEKQ